MSNIDKDRHENSFHYEEGIPVLDVKRLDAIEVEQAAAKKRDERYRDEQLRVNKWMMCFTGLLFACAVLGGGISGYQAHVAKLNARAASENAQAAQDTVKQMKASSADTHDLAVQAANQADATKKIAEEAVNQARATKRLADEAHGSNAQAIESDRPWIGMAKFDPVDLVANDTNTFQMEFINTGRRPAYIELSEIAIFHYKVFPRDPWYPDVQYASQGILVPNVPMVLHHSFGIRKEWIEAATPGSDFGEIYAYARIVYRDVKTKSLHHTYVCEKYLATAKWKGFARCDSYNNAD